LRVAGMLVQIGLGDRRAAARLVDHCGGDRQEALILDDFLDSARGPVDAAAGTDANDDFHVSARFPRAFLRETG